MDELNAVRQLLAERPAPRPEVVEEARRILSATLASSDAGRPRRRRRVRPLIVAAVAAGAAAALTAVTLVPGPATPRHTSHAVAPRHVTAGVLDGHAARSYLLAMAVRASQTAAARYWCTDEIDGGRELVGAHDTLLSPPWQNSRTSTPATAPAGYQYSIMTRSGNDRCLGRDGTYFAGGYSQQLSAQPASPADAAAWRRAGSPARWRAWYARQWVTTRAGHRYVLPAGGKGPISEPWGSNAALPASPARLRRVLLSVAINWAGLDVVLGPGHARDKYFEYVASDLLDEVIMVMLAPVRPAVRAAAYQVIASIPGIQVRPGSQGPEGRTGTALWLSATAAIPVRVPPPARSRRPRLDGPVPAPPSPGTREVEIVDPATGNLLAQDTVSTVPARWLPPGSVIDYSVYATRWTSTLPSFAG